MRKKANAWKEKDSLSMVAGMEVPVVGIISLSFVAFCFVDTGQSDSPLENETAFPWVTMCPTSMQLLLRVPNLRGGCALGPVAKRRRAFDSWEKFTRGVALIRRDDVPPLEGRCLNFRGAQHIRERRRPGQQG
jgi:hypothetical protein